MDLELEKIIKDTSGQCIICFDEMNANNGVVCCQNKVWSSNKYCIDCLEYYKNVMWKNHLSNVVNPDCLKSFKRSVNNPLPYYLTSDTMISNNIITDYYNNGKISSGELVIPFSKEKTIQINNDIEFIKNKIVDDDFDYISELHFFVERHGLQEYKK